MAYEQFSNIISHSCNYVKETGVFLKHYFNNSQNSNNISISYQFLKHYFKAQVMKEIKDKKKGHRK